MNKYKIVQNADGRSSIYGPDGGKMAHVINYDAAETLRDLANAHLDQKPHTDDEGTVVMRTAGASILLHGPDSDLVMSIVADGRTLFWVRRDGTTRNTGETPGAGHAAGTLFVEGMRTAAPSLFRVGGTHPLLDMYRADLAATLRQTNNERDAMAAVTSLVQAAGKLAEHAIERSPEDERTVRVVAALAAVLRVAEALEQ